MSEIADFFGECFYLVSSWLVVVFGQKFRDLLDVDGVVERRRVTNLALVATKLALKWKKTLVF